MKPIKAPPPIDFRKLNVVITLKDGLYSYWANDKLIMTSSIDLSKERKDEQIQSE